MTQHQSTRYTRCDGSQCATAWTPAGWVDRRAAELASGAGPAPLPGLVAPQAAPPRPPGTMRQSSSPRRVAPCGQRCARPSRRHRLRRSDLEPRRGMARDQALGIAALQRPNSHAETAGRKSLQSLQAFPRVRLVAGPSKRPCSPRVDHEVVKILSELSSIDVRRA